MPRFRPVPAAATDLGDHTGRGVAARLRATAAIESSGLTGQADALLALVEAGALERGAEAVTDRAEDACPVPEGPSSYADGWRGPVPPSRGAIKYAAPRYN